MYAEINIEINVVSISRHCLVLEFLDQRFSIESLVRSVAVVLMHKLFNILADA